MQRAVPDAVLGRALGALDGLLLAGLGLGAVAAPGLIEAVGPEAALVIVGVLLPTLALLTRPILRPLDATTSAPEGTSLLRSVPMLAVGNARSGSPLARYASARRPKRSE